MEKLVYKTFENFKKKTNLCLHIHYPIKSNNKAFLFLNPLFYEKKRSQKFQATTARELVKCGYTIIRFDYYGTGDSYGDFRELTTETCVENCKSLLNFIRDEIGILDISILGIRWGASIALEVSSFGTEIKNLFLLNPIVSGKRYLTELRLQRKAFYMLNNIKKKEDKQQINGVHFEDHQGYLMSPFFTEELGKYNLFTLSVSNKNIFLFSLDMMNHKKLLEFNENLNYLNKVDLIKKSTKPFWNNNEINNTDLLTNEILKHV